MIPKIIHYCWFGGNPLPESAKRNIASWKKYCPDYEIKEWNENNFDVNCMPFVKEAYEAKKYAFVSDVARLLVVNENGGIYFDTDVELIKNIDFLLENIGFVAFENELYVNTGCGFGSERKSYFLKEMIDKYRSMSLNCSENSLSSISCPKINTEVMVDNGLKLNDEFQVIKGVVVLPSEYMNPLNSITGQVNKTDNTVSIHWYKMSWLPIHKKIRALVLRPIRRILSINKISKKGKYKC